MLVSYNGITSGFQPDDGGSIPSTRTNTMKIYCEKCYEWDYIDNYLNMTGEYKPIDWWYWPKCCDEFMALLL